MENVVWQAAEVQVPLWLQTVFAIFGGGVFGSLVSTVLTAGRDGRSARATVRERLSAAEDLRWTDSDYKEFRRAVSELESAALMARVDPGLIERYVYIATVAHYTELQERQRNPGYPPRTLPLELANVVEYTLLRIIHELWAPWYRHRAGRSKWAIDNLTRQALRRNPGWAWNTALTVPNRVAREPGVVAWVVTHMPPLARRIRARNVRIYEERLARSLPGGFLDD